MTGQQDHLISWRDLPGSAAVLKLLLAYGREAQSPETLIIYGRNGLGKNHYAKAIAARYFCREHTACGACDECVRVILQSHSEVLCLNGEEKSIKKDDIEQVFSFLSFSSQGLQKVRTVIILHAHLLTIAAANALLKVLEEPPAQTRFILTTDKLDNLMTTVLSRAHKFYIPPPPAQESLAWLEQQVSSSPKTHAKSFSQERARQALMLCGYVPSQALNLLMSDDSILGGASDPLLPISDLSPGSPQEQSFMADLRGRDEALEYRVNFLEASLSIYYNHILQDKNKSLVPKLDALAIKLRRQRLSLVRQKGIKSLISLNTENMLEYITGSPPTGEDPLGDTFF